MSGSIDLLIVYLDT